MDSFEISSSIQVLSKCIRCAGSRASGIIVGKFFVLQLFHESTLHVTIRCVAGDAASSCLAVAASSGRRDGGGAIKRSINI